MERGGEGPTPRPRPRKEDSGVSDSGESTSLSAVVQGIVQALREAQHMGDIESARLAEAYKKEKPMLSFTVPAFKIADVEIELHFAVRGTVEGEKKGETTDVMIDISPSSLKELDAAKVSVMKLKITPTNLKVFEESK